MGNSENLAGVRTAYDTVAEAYSEALPDTSFETRLDMAMTNDFCARLRAAPGRKVIDAGCGAGRLSVRLAEAGLDVTGVDLSPGMVRVAQRSHPGLAFEVGELTALPAADAAAHGILAWYSIIHASPPELRQIAQEFWRALRPGGWALIAFQAGSGQRPAHHRARLRARRRTPGRTAQSRRRRPPLHGAGLRAGGATCPGRTGRRKTPAGNAPYGQTGRPSRSGSPLVPCGGLSYADPVAPDPTRSGLADILTHSALTLDSFR